MLNKALFTFNKQGQVRSWQMPKLGSSEYENMGKELDFLYLNPGSPASSL